VTTSPASSGKPELAPARISTLRDKLAELQRCGIDHVVVAPFNEALPARPQRPSSTTCCVRGLAGALRAGG
jgi:riboflavin kinase/FMN adenylyltransferase